ncbi:unnamed protein product [Trichogramma brassicae]|uniref:Secreted protein n=1 Tax=Trichogramma brassicae TaxID=86971 RepID=A0A6H5ICB6_9HYME|nr:unnamed protein product [Trichogramma brassicae]
MRFSAAVAVAAAAAVQHSCAAPAIVFQMSNNIVRCLIYLLFITRSYIPCIGYMHSYRIHTHVKHNMLCTLQQRQHQQQQQEFKWKYRLLLRSIEGRRRRSGGGGDGGGAEEEGMRDRCRASNDTILGALGSR